MLARDFFLVRIAVFAASGKSLVRAGRVVITATIRVRESVVSVVDLLELLGARRTLGGVRGDTVGMGFQGLS